MKPDVTLLLKYQYLVDSFWIFLTLMHEMIRVIRELSTLKLDIWECLIFFYIVFTRFTLINKICSVWLFHSCIFKYLSGRTDRQTKVLKYGRTERQMNSSNQCSKNGDTLTFQAGQKRQRGLGHLIGTHWLVRPHRVRLVKVKMSHPQDWFYWGPRTDRWQLSAVILLGVWPHLLVF